MAQRNVIRIGRGGSGGQGGEVHPVDQLLPPQRLAILGLQHLFIMYAGAVPGRSVIGRGAQIRTARGDHALGVALGVGQGLGADRQLKPRLVSRVEIGP